MRAFLCSIVVCFCFFMLSACSGPESTTAPTVETVVVEVTREVPVTQVVEVVQEVTVIVTATPVPPSPTPTLAPTEDTVAIQQATAAAIVAEIQATLAAAPTDTPAPSPTPTPDPFTITVDSGMNVRSGPGTNYAVVAGLVAGDTVQVIARNTAGDWYEVTLANGSTGWLAAWLVDGPEAESVSVAANIPTPPPTPVPPTAAPTVQAISPESRYRSIGEEVEAGGWRFSVKEVHKRKTVYFYSRSQVAFGNYLIVIIDAVNLQSGTDYFARNIDPYVAFPDSFTGVRHDLTATGYAQWQYEGISSVFTDVNPGVFTRMAMAFDLPEDTGRVLLSTEVLEWFDLGVFRDLPLGE